ncbi:MAG: 30S ribosome-binding factor RbfA [Acidimicrobiia bacterium]
MAGRNARRPSREFPRTLRLNQLVQEIVADELGRIDDERLEMVTVMKVEVEPGMRHAVVYFDTMGGIAGDDEVLDALAEARVRLQRAVGQQARTKRTPELRFEADTVERRAGRVEDILRDLRPGDPE